MRRSVRSISTVPVSPSADASEVQRGKGKDGGRKKRKRQPTLLLGTKAHAGPQPRLAPHVLEITRQAMAFTVDTHGADVARLSARLASPLSGRHASFARFFHEYAYVIVASGFRASIAARLSSALVEAAPRGYDEMLTVFGNRAKVGALAELWRIGESHDWPAFAARALVDVDTLEEHLPRIGPTVKYHLGRNLGLTRDVAKPDVHMMRLAEECGWTSVQAMCEAVTAALDEAEWQRWLSSAAAGAGEATPAATAAPSSSPPSLVGPCVGLVDFALWVFLSHRRGVADPACCHGMLQLR